MKTETKESVADLRARAKEAGIDVPARASKADVEKLLEQQMQQNVEEANAVAAEAAKANAAASPAPPKPVEIPEGVIPGETPGWPVDENGDPLDLTPEQRKELAINSITEELIENGELRRPIERVTERGDWLDPFCGEMIYYGDQVSLITGARRDGDDAVLSDSVLSPDED